MRNRSFALFPEVPFHDVMDSPLHDADNFFLVLENAKLIYERAIRPENGHAGTDQSSLVGHAR